MSAKKEHYGSLTLSGVWGEPAVDSAIEASAIAIRMFFEQFPAGNERAKVMAKITTSSIEPLNDSNRFDDEIPFGD
jgi:hypothetical protein